MKELVATIFIAVNMELLYTSAISPSLGLLEPGIHGELNLSLRPGSLWLLSISP